ncbi:hypothetical protein ABG067_005390 [Albugo candida]
MCNTKARFDRNKVVDLSPSGSGTHCETYEYGLRSKMPCIFVTALSVLPNGLTVPLVENTKDWIVEYMEAKITSSFNELPIFREIKNRGSIEFVVTMTELYLPSSQHDTQLGKSKTKFSFKFKNGHIEFEIANGWIKVNDKNEWLFGTQIMEILDVRLRKEKNCHVVFNKKDFAED